MEEKKNTSIHSNQPKPDDAIYKFNCKHWLIQLFGRIVTMT